MTTDRSAATSAASATLFGPQRAGACIGAVALVSLLAFEAMAVAAAMPAVARALAGLELYALAFGGMLATSMLGMVLAGRSCDRHGAVPATAIGLAVFTSGLVLAGVAGSMGMLVVGRIVQGLGSGMLGVALYVGMGQLIPAPLHPRLFALLAAAWVVPGLVGPLTAAWLVEQWGWRSVFLVVAAAMPAAAWLLLPAFQRLPRPTAPAGPTATASHPEPGLAEAAAQDTSAVASKAAPAAPAPTSLAWAALAVAGALLLHAAGRPDARAWMLPLMALGLVTALVAATRLLPPGSVTARAGLPAVIALRGLLAAAFATAEVFLPLYLTHRAGWTLTTAGLALSTGAVFWSAGSALQARIADPARRRRGLQAGFVAVAAGIGGIAAQDLAGWPAWTVVPAWALAGFGIGLAFPMLSVLTLSLSPPAEQGRNASALQLSDALGCSAALALAGALFAGADPAGRQGYLLVLGLATGLAALGAVLAGRAFGRAPSPGFTRPRPGRRGADRSPRRSPRPPGRRGAR